MTPEMTDARGRRNPGAFMLWARALAGRLSREYGPDYVRELIDNRRTHGGLGARTRRRLRRQNLGGAA